MADSNLLFLQIWRNEKIRRRLVSHINNDSLCALRLTNSACSNIVTRPLFARIRLTFTPSALSRPSRLEALARIGHHIEHLTFSMPHIESTFLPPLLNPVTGREVNFLYTPHTSLASEAERPKYGTEELGDYLTQQYPPIFHAATNVPAFIRALACMPNLRHLSVSCPDQEPCQRYRRSAVDYALISLRIAVERADLTHLQKLSLAVHPAALLYLHPTSNFGASPSALRRWRQIRNLKLSIDAWPFESSHTDHLKLLTNYLRTFSNSVEKLTFHWYGQRGPCPLTLHNNASRPSSPNSATKLFAEITSPMSPLPPTPSPAPLHFQHLRRLSVRNTFVAAEQVSSLVRRHGSTLRSIDFDNVILTSGTWDEALEPLNGLGSKDRNWEARHSDSGSDLSSRSFPRYPADDEDWDSFNLHDSSDLYVDGELATTPSSTHLHKRRVRKRRRAHRRPATPPSPTTIRRQASNLLERLKHSAMEASQTTFFSRFLHSENSSSPSTISDPFIHAPQHNREMPLIPLAFVPELAQPEALAPLYHREMPPILVASVPELAQPEPTLLQPATYTPPRRTPTPPRPTTPTGQLSPLLPPATFVADHRTPSPKDIHPLRRSPMHSPGDHSPSTTHHKRSPTSPTRHHQTPTSSTRSPQTPNTPWPSAMTLTPPRTPPSPRPLPAPHHLNPAIHGVQRNLAQEAAHQDLVDDAEKRTCALRQAREAVLQRLGRQFCDRTAARSDGEARRRAKEMAERKVQRQVKVNMMIGGGVGVDAGVRAVGDGMQKGMMVPLMIFR